MKTCCEYHNMSHGCNQGRACPEQQQTDFIVLIVVCVLLIVGIACAAMAYWGN